MPRSLLWALVLAVALIGCTPGAQSLPAPAPAPLQGTATAGCLAQAPTPPAQAQRVTVRRVVDGDTVELDDRDRTKVRLIGINTPESVDPRRPVQAYGKEATAFARGLLEGQAVLLQRGRTPYDRYRRLLAWLWLPDGHFVNALIVQQGYAQVYTFSDNPDHAALLLACQREARDAQRGLWSLPEYRSGKEAAK